MLPMMCSHEACKNIEGRIGSNSRVSEEADPAANDRSKWTGTTPNWYIRLFKARCPCPPTDNSNRKTTVFRAIMKYVTSGVLKRGVSSRMGIMRDSDRQLRKKRAESCGRSVRLSAPASWRYFQICR